MTDRSAWPRRFHQVVAASFALGGVHAVRESLRWPILGDLGPGPGLLPLCLGVGTAILSLVWLLRLSIGTSSEKLEPLPGAGGALRIATILGATVAFGVLLNALGFMPTMFGLVLAIMLVLRASVLSAVVTALVTSVTIYYLFALLDVPLPTVGLG